MALVVADRVLETSSTAGTGTLSLLGAVSGYKSFSNGIGDGNSTYYCIYDPIAYAWEVGIGTYTASGSTLSRTTVLSNSLNTTALINFAGNTMNVFCTLPSEYAVTQIVAGTGVTISPAGGTGAVTINASGGGGGSSSGSNIFLSNNFGGF